MLKKARSVAGREASGKVAESRGEMRESLGREIRRLRSLAEVNDHVDPEEVAGAEKRKKAIEKAIGSAGLRLDSLRLIWLGLGPART